jgi:hypothetical protein
MSASKFFVFLLAFSFAQIPSLSDPPSHPKDIPKNEFSLFKFNCLESHSVESSSFDFTIPHTFKTPIASILKTPAWDVEHSRNGKAEPPPSLPSTPNSTPWPKRVTLSYNHTTGDCQRWWDDYAMLGIMLAPQYRYGRVLPILDLQVERMDHHRYGANIGVAGRYISSRANQILGLNLFYDFQQGHRGLYHQAGMGFEWLSKRWDVRANAYIPLTEKHSKHCVFDDYIGDFVATRTCSTYTLYGVNAEAGYLAVQSKNFLLYVAAGPYYIGRSSIMEDALGARLRIRPQFRDYIAMDFSVSSDRIFKTVFQSAVIIYFPLYQISPQNSSHRRLTDRQIYQPIERFNLSPLFKRCCWHTNW